MLARLYQDLRPSSRFAFAATAVALLGFAPFVAFNNPWAELANPYWMRTFAVIAVLTLAILWNQTILDYELLKGHQYGGLFFLVALAVNPAALALNPGLVALAALVFAIRRLLDLYQTGFVSLRVFDAGLYLGLGTLVYPAMVLWLPLFWIGIVVLGQGNWRNLIIPVFGLFSVWMFVFTYYFWIDQSQEFVTRFLAEPFSFGWKTNWEGWQPLAFVALLAVYAFKEYFVAMSRANNYRRQVLSWLVLLVIALVLFTLFTAIPCSELAMWLAFPASVLFANYYQFLKKRWWKELLYVALVSAVWWIPLIK